MGRFAKTLGRLRREVGFATPYAFYHRNGGKRAFPFTYAYYTKLERGLSLPRGEWLPLLIDMLRIRLTDNDERALVVDYVRDLFGNDTGFDALVGPLLKPHGEAPATKRVIKRFLGEQAWHLSPKQFEVIVSSPAAYWTFNCLLNNAKPLKPDTLAAATGLHMPDVRRAAERLASAKCLKRRRGGAYVCPFAGRYCVYPRGYDGYAKHLRALERIIETIDPERGEEILRAGAVFRTTTDSARAVAKSFMETIEAESAESIYEPVEGSGLFAFETRIRKVLPF